MILKKKQFWFETYGNPKATVLGDWFENFLIRTGNEEELKKLLRKVHETGLLDLLTKSGRSRTSRSCVLQPGAVADWWYSWPMASTLASLCLIILNITLWLSVCFLCTWWTLRFIPCLMHYKSMKCDVLFLLGSVSTIFRWDGHFSYTSNKFLPLYNGAKIMKKSIKIFRSYDHKMYCHFFMVYSV